eukprot:scaffold507_cov391-Prasinococcus_capsulatus_cf.AAC.3
MMLDAELRGFTDFRDDFDDLNQKDENDSAEDEAIATERPRVSGADRQETVEDGGQLVSSFKEPNGIGKALAAARSGQARRKRKLSTAQIHTPFPVNPYERFKMYSQLWKDEVVANILMEDERLAILARRELKRRIRASLKAEAALEE